MVQTRQLGKPDLQQLIAQARAIAEFRPPKDKQRALTAEEVQQVTDLLGLKTESANAAGPKKKPRTKKGPRSKK